MVVNVKISWNIDDFELGIKKYTTEIVRLNVTRFDMDEYDINSEVEAMIQEKYGKSYNGITGDFDIVNMTEILEDINFEEYLETRSDDVFS